MGRTCGSTGEARPAIDAHRAAPKRKHARGEGRIDSIFDPIQKYIPETVGTEWEDTSVEDLLQMESGIYWVDVPVHQPEELILMGLDFHTNGLYGMTRNDYLLQLTRVSERGEYYQGHGLVR